MALFPVYTNERDPNGLFKAKKTWAGGDGGLVVRVTAEGTTSAPLHTSSQPCVDYITSGATNVSGPMFGLLDEDMVRPGTLVGSFLAPNASPQGIGPATYLGSGKLTIWQTKGYFLTDNFQAVLTSTTLYGDGYGEPANLNPGDALLCTPVDVTFGGVLIRRGTICDQATCTAIGAGTGATTKLTYAGFADDVADLFGSYVSPAPTTGMFRDGPRMLIFQN